MTFKLNAITLTVITIRANAVVSQCLTKNNRFENIRWVGAFSEYVIMSVGEFNFFTYFLFI